MTWGPLPEQGKDKVRWFRELKAIDAEVSGTLTVGSIEAVVSQRGALLAGTNGIGFSTSTTAPGNGTYSAVITETITLDTSGQSVIVEAHGWVRCSNLDETEDYSFYIDIDGDPATPGDTDIAIVDRGLITADQPSHSHAHTHGTEPGMDVAGVSGDETAGTPHTHTSGTYGTATHVHAQNATTADPAITVAVGDDKVTISNFHGREFTPSGTTFDIKLMAQENGGATSWHNRLMWRVSQA
jgi:hypothetical protein